MPQTLPHRQARVMIAERLETLGHAPEFLAPEAVEELLKRSGSAAQALHAALSATLFLASTEDVVRVGRDLVERAVPADISDYTAVPAAPRPGPWRLVYLAVPLVLACAGAAIWLRKPVTPPLVSIAKAPVAKPAAVKPPVIKAVPRPAPPTAPAKASPKEAPKPPPKPPSVAAVAQKPPSPLPVPPPDAVTLLVAPTGGAAQGQLPALLASLLPAGFSQIDVAPSPRGEGRPVAVQHHRVSYFFQQDEALAQQVAKQLNGADAADAVHAPWRAVLVPLPPGAPPRAPGSLEADAR